MSTFDTQWGRVVRNIITNGKFQKTTKSKYISDDAPAPTRYVIGEQMRFGPDEMPMLFSKDLKVKLAFEELKNILIEKTTKIQDFRDDGITFWDQWEYPEGHEHEGTMGKAYAYQVREKKIPVKITEINRELLAEETKLEYDKLVNDTNLNWEYMQLDQVDVLVQRLARAKEYGIGRSNIITLLDQEDVEEMAIFPCVWSHEYFVDEDHKLYIKLHIRSNDIALGNAFNIVQYYIWLCILCQVCGLKRGELIVPIGDAHLYDRHILNAILMMDEIEKGTYDNKKATIKINAALKSIYDVQWGDIMIEGYEPGPGYKFDLSYTTSPLTGK